MKIYISGIFGTGMKPLALMAKDAGFLIFGSDKNSAVLNDDDLVRSGILVSDEQNGDFLQKCTNEGGLDWYVHSSAMSENHPELVKARELDLKITKRDEFIAFLVEKLGLKMVAVAGTHGKTTTTAMIIWAMRQLGVRVSYLVGSSLPFAPAGHYEPTSNFLIYEADEYDRNFLRFSPWLSVITAVSYDHPDIYKTKEEYLAAFAQFVSQSEQVIVKEDTEKMPIFTEKCRFLPALEGDFDLSGAARRYDASLAGGAVFAVLNEVTGDYRYENQTKTAEIKRALASFPGVGRRFEKIADGIYSDYAHHPEEIQATIEIAKEEASRCGLKGVVAIYEPHQNSRQHEVFNEYREVFDGVEQLFWLPTFLTREDERLKVIEPEEFIKSLSDKVKAEKANLDEKLAENIKKWRNKGYLVLLMTAGPADLWLRNLLF